MNCFYCKDELKINLSHEMCDYECKNHLNITVKFYNESNGTYSVRLYHCKTSLCIYIIDHKDTNLIRIYNDVGYVKTIHKIPKNILTPENFVKKINILLTFQ